MAIDIRPICPGDCPRGGLAPGPEDGGRPEMRNHTIPPRGPRGGGPPSSLILPAVRPCGFDIARFVLSAALLAAATLKWQGLAADGPADGAPFAPRWLLFGAVEVEWAMGLWLLTGLHPEQTRHAATACFAAFACIALTKAMGGETSCGCFGRLTISPWYTLAFDIAALAALRAFRPPPSPPRTIRSDPRRFVRCVTWLALATVGLGWAALSGDPAGHIIIEPRTWVGRRLPLLERIDIGERLLRGDWILVFYHRGCGRCRETIPEYDRLARTFRDRSSSTQFALVEVPPHEDPAQGLIPPDSPCLRGRLDAPRNWLVPTPSAMTVRDGYVASLIGAPKDIAARPGGARSGTGEPGYPTGRPACDVGALLVAGPAIRRPRPDSARFPP
jgi:methylamine utilization protein MauE